MPPTTIQSEELTLLTTSHEVSFLSYSYYYCLSELTIVTNFHQLIWCIILITALLDPRDPSDRLYLFVISLLPVERR